QVEAFEAQRRQPEQEAGDEADRAGDRDRRPVRPTRLVHQDRRRVRTDRVERAVAERDLAVVAGQHVEPEQRDRVREHERDLEDAVVGDEERQRAREHEQHREARELAAIEPAHQTRTTWTLPNRPEGLTTRTPMMTTSASVSLSSLPT